MDERPTDAHATPRRGRWRSAAFASTLVASLLGFTGSAVGLLATGASPPTAGLGEPTAVVASAEPSRTNRVAPVSGTDAPAPVAEALVASDPACPWTTPRDARPEDDRA